MKEFDRVQSTVDIEEVPVGAEGTIVHVYANNNLAVEVEFAAPHVVKCVHVLNLKVIDATGN